jgi:hypothetical protein
LAQLKASLTAHKIMKENTVFPSTRFIVKRIQFQGMVPAFMVIALTLFPLLASAGEDPCRETGIYIGNQTLLNLWYTRNGGDCTIWAHGHILIIKPEDKLIVFRDNICETEYCSENLTYKVYKSLDANQNCRVRILPNCALSDM